MKTVRTPFITAIVIGLLAGSAVGAAAQDAADESTGRWAVGGQVLPDTEEPGDGWELTTGGAWQVSTLEMTDPRFDGEVVVYTNWYDVNPGTAESMDVRKSMWRIENEDGSWQSDVIGGVDFPGVSGKTQFHIFEGDGAYDGLTAFVELDMHGHLTDLRGVTFCLWSLGDCERALDLAEQVLETRTRVLGPGHPATQATWDLLAALEEAAPLSAMASP